jgi:hypothetical protein
MRIYVHREASPDALAIETSETTVLADALEIDDGDVVLLENVEVELDVAQSVQQAGVADRAHVFRGRRARVVAEVQYNGESISREFSASARVDRVFRWATGSKGFKLSKPDAAEHTLQLSDHTVPHSDVHLGSLDDTTPGRVSFSLVPKHRFEG